jgi:hypothetical protein
MRSPRILARPWRAPLTPAISPRAPAASRLLTVTPCPPESAPWGQFRRIPPRVRGTAGAPVERGEPSAAPGGRENPVSGAAPAAWRGEVRPRAKPRTEAGQEWDRAAARAVLEARGEAFVLGRFEALAARQRSASGSAGTLGEALRELQALGIRPSARFYALALEVGWRFSPGVGR